MILIIVKIVLVIKLNLPFVCLLGKDNSIATMPKKNEKLKVIASNDSAVSVLFSTTRFSYTRPTI